MAVDRQYAVPQYPDGTPSFILWGRCKAKGCKAYQCTWADHPNLCFPHNQEKVGRPRMVERWNETHDAPMQGSE
jgi:hypothetical protein